MLIACKCLNIILGAAASPDNDAVNRRPQTFNFNHVLDQNGDLVESGEQLPFVLRATLERLATDQVNFFKTVGDP